MHIEEGEALLMEASILRIDLTITKTNQTIIGLIGRTRITDRPQIQLVHLLTADRISHEHRMPVPVQKKTVETLVLRYTPIGFP